MRVYLCIVLTCVAISQTTISGQESTEQDFKFLFEKARNYLVVSRTQKALPILEKLANRYPENYNVSYLLGICLTETQEVTDMSIYYLLKASKSVSKDYVPNDYQEQRAPIFLYYFLTIAYAQNRLCKEAYTSFESFRNLYGKTKNDFYITDALNWATACIEPDGLEELEIASAHSLEAPQKPELKPTKPKEDPRPTPQKTTQSLPEKTVLDTISATEASRPLSPNKSDKYVTKTQTYSTFNSVYGIQVGAGSKAIPIYEFEGLKNVNAYLGTSGLIRYVVGKFGSKKQAAILLDVVKQKGYTDAFIVDINKATNYKEEIIMFNDVSIKKTPNQTKDISFSVQIGVFNDTIPAFLAKKFVEVDGVIQFVEDNRNVMASGRFQSYKTAQNYKTQLTELGIPGCFIIALKNGQKIRLEKHMTIE